MKNEEEITKNIYSTDYNLFIEQNLWQAHYQILSISFLKEFVKLNVNTEINSEICGIKYKYCVCFLEYVNFKDDLTEYKCLCSNKNHQQKFHGKFKERLFNTYKFPIYNKNEFILFLRKGV